MVGTRRRPRNPTIAKSCGTDYKTVIEGKSEEENKLRTNKLQHYTSKKKVILLPGTVMDMNEQTEKKKKD